MAVDTTQSDQLFNEARQSQQNVIDLTQQGGKLPSMLRDAVTERFSQSPLFEQRERAAENYITSSPRAREDVANLVSSGTILSPTQQQSIIAGNRAADLVPLLSLNDLLQAQTGGMETAIAGGLGQFNAMLNALTQTAGLQQQSAQSAFDRAITEEQLRLREREIDKSGSGGGGGILEQILAAQMLGGMGGGGTATPPQYTPIYNGAYDQQPDGSIWQYRDNQWIEVTDPTQIQSTPTNSGSSSKINSGVQYIS